MSRFPLRVAVINANRKWGGVKTWTLDFGRVLQERGHRVTAVVRSGTPFVDACRDAGFQVVPFRFGGKYDLLAIARLTRILRRERVEVVIANISKDLEAGGVAARLCRVPLLHRVGLVEDFRGTWGERLRHRWLVSRILVPAAWMGNALGARFDWMDGNRIHAIPNSKRVQDYPVSQGSGQTPPVFGVASQLSPSKGHRHLLKALELSLLMGTRIQLRIAGTGHLEAELREVATSLGLEEMVRWEGFVRDIPGFLGGLDGFVLPSLKEGFPNTLLEALCAGLPAIASDLPGAREMVGAAGLLVDAGDEGALAEALGKLASDPDLRRSLGRAARTRAEESFDVEKNAVRLESLLERMVREGPPR